MIGDRSRLIERLLVVEREARIAVAGDSRTSLRALHRALQEIDRERDRIRRGFPPDDPPSGRLIATVHRTHVRDLKRLAERRQ